MFTVFEEVGVGRFKRDSVVTKQLTTGGGGNQQLLPPQLSFRDGLPEIKGEIVLVSDYIRLVEVPIVTPNCDIVVPSLTFKVGVYFPRPYPLPLTTDHSRRSPPTCTC